VTSDGSTGAGGGEPTKRPRILLAEDSPEMAAELAGLLSVEFEVAEVVRDGPALIEMAFALEPDAIVTDIGMPGSSGLTAAGAILARRPATPIVLVSIHCERGLVERALAVGALGFVAKRDAGDELTVATQHALRGRQYLSFSVRAAFENRPSRRRLE
jgi:DNA-binding NarL/FixJ family response regulator